MLKAAKYGAFIAIAGMAILHITRRNANKQKEIVVQGTADRRRRTTLAAIDSTVRFPSIPEDQRKQITKCDALGLRAGLESQKFTSEEILLTYIHNIREVGKEYNAVLDECFVEALEQANQCDQERAQGKLRGQLHGIPISVKDCIPVKGTVTWYGHAVHSFNTCPDDANLIKALKRNGAIPFVKTNMPPGGNSTETRNHMFGAVPNPFDATRSAGGSSGGEGALIALGWSALGLGTDIGGSIRIPAAFCGLCGLKPGSSRFPSESPIRRGGPPAQLSCWGPMAHTVNDLELAMSAICDEEAVTSEHTVSPIPWRGDLYTSTRKMTIGYVLQDDSWVEVPECQTRAVRIAKEKLESLGHTLVEFKPPQLSDVTIAILQLMAGKRPADTHGEKLMQHYTNSTRLNNIPEAMRPFYSKWFDYVGQKVDDFALKIKISLTKSWVDFQNAYQTLYQYRHEFFEKWCASGIDALIWPMYSPPWKLDTFQNLMPIITHTLLFNGLDYPVAYVPNTQVNEDEQFYEGNANPEIKATMQEMMKDSKGLSIGVQVVAQPYNEELCLNIANQVFGGSMRKNDEPIAKNSDQADQKVSSTAAKPEEVKLESKTTPQSQEKQLFESVDSQFLDRPEQNSDGETEELEQNSLNEATTFDEFVLKSHQKIKAAGVDISDDIDYIKDVYKIFLGLEVQNHLDKFTKGCGEIELEKIVDALLNTGEELSINFDEMSRLLDNMRQYRDKLQLSSK